MKLGWTYPQRKKHIEESLKTAPKRSIEIEFQGRKRVPIPILTLDITFPKYRLSNGRTYDLQAEYIVKNPTVGTDFFTKDPEFEQAQHAQHELLKELIGGKDLYEYFQTHEQTDPLMLDNDGFVVNGNRRLCAMRELLEQDAKNYSHFNAIDCAILPPATDEAIDELEARLQEHPDIKDRYTWTSRVIMYKARKKERGYDDAMLAKIYETTEKEIRLLYQMLGSADVYLRSREKEGQYHLVSDAEYGFRPIVLCRADIQDPADKDLFENIAFCIIDHKATVGDRVYKFIPSIANNLDKVKAEIKIELGAETEANTISDFGELGHLIRERDNLLPLVTNRDNSEIVKDIVIDLIESERTKKREDKKKNASLYLLGRALSDLKEAAGQIQSLGPSKVIDVDTVVTAIEESLEMIKKWIRANSSD